MSGACSRSNFNSFQNGAIVTQEHMSEENPDELFCSAVAGDQNARERLMHSHPGYVFRKCNTGDQNAVVQLWLHFYPEAKRVVQSRTSSKLKHLIDASSILSDVNLSLLKRFENLSQSQIQQLQIQFDKTPRLPVDTYARLRAWYMKIVVNRLIDVIRGVEKIPIPPRIPPEQNYDPPDNRSSVSERVIRKEYIKLCENAINDQDEKSEKLRSIYKLRLMDYTYAQISDELMIFNVATVRNRLKKAHKLIESRLRLGS